jgi:hypothetical protein
MMGEKQSSQITVATPVVVVSVSSGPLFWSHAIAVKPRVIANRIEVFFIYFCLRTYLVPNLVTSIDRKNQKNDSKNNAQCSGHHGKVIRKQRQNSHAQKNQSHKRAPNQFEIQFFHYLF